MATQGDTSALGAVKHARHDLLDVPTELAGDWGGSLPEAAHKVILRMRRACLRDIRLLSDRQPKHLRVEHRASGPPAIWLHSDPPDTAWVLVDIGARDWSKLAYQFGHELGHVLANSWDPTAKPLAPCQWLEESLVEAFSIRGLERLASDWEKDPPFAGDNAFSLAIRRYAADLITRYSKAHSGVAAGNLKSWFRERRGDIEVNGGVSERIGPAIIAIRSAYAEDIACIEDLGALNRWPERTSLPLGEYLARWQKSCREIDARGRMPQKLASLLGIE